MYQTVQVSTCVSAQGEFVETLPNGDAIVRDGHQVYRGRPIAPVGKATGVERGLRAVTRPGEEG